MIFDIKPANPSLVRTEQSIGERSRLPAAAQLHRYTKQTILRRSPAGSPLKQVVQSPIVVGRKVQTQRPFQHRPNIAPQPLRDRPSS